MNRLVTRFGAVSAMLLLGAVAMAPNAFAQSEASAEAVRVDRLAQNLERAESVRAVKNLQRSYAQYSQFGLWDEMAALFADDAEMIRGDIVVNGRDAISEFLVETFGNGEHGLPPGGLHTQLVFRPLINVAADGETAKGRWWEWSLTGQFGGDADWAGGIYENEYVLEDGVWKFARVHYHPMLAGPYESGWRNVDADQKVVPYHFTTDETGIPVPELAADAPMRNPDLNPETVLPELEQRIAAMNAEDQVRNLQNAYGYYVDRKMWDDVVDLFAEDAILEPADGERYEGPASIRRAYERMGPAGLEDGQLNDHMQLDMIVAVGANGLEAQSRGIEWALLGDAEAGTAQMQLAVFLNRYVFEVDAWRIIEMRVFPVMKTDYYEGWAKSQLFEPEPGAIPDFMAANPVTGEPVSLPEGTHAVGTDSLFTDSRPRGEIGRTASAEDRLGVPMSDRLAEAERKLAVSKAWDGAENVSAAYGDYLDDLDFGPLAAIFAVEGTKQIPFTGFYVSRESIAARDQGRSTPAEPRPRTSLPLHLRTQPVIHVAEDGRSAAIRTRLFQPQSSRTRAMGLGSGMYNDQVVLEDGIWRFWHVAIDEHYFQSAGYEGGWSGVEPADPASLQRQGGVTGASYPPDIPLIELGVRQQGFRGGTGTTLAWPSILPMWFHYRNPVSGRVPERYWPDCVTCIDFPETSMANHGWLLPPN